MDSHTSKIITSGLDAVERIQVNWFFSHFTQEYYREYQFGHALLLAYAAVPAYLTPDLLYKMRQNFSGYQWGNKTEYIHSLAVCDILMAPFCREISHELYRMNENVRLALLRWMSSSDPMWKNCDPATIEEIARFIKQYHDAPNEATVRHGEKYREEQDFEARLYFDSAEVANEYLEILRNAKDKRETLTAINALIRAKTMEDLLEPAQKQFSHLFPGTSLEMWKDSLQENVDALAANIHHDRNNPVIRQLFKTQANTKESVLVKLKKTDPVSKRQIEAMMPAKKIAVFIGLAPADSPNCERMRVALEVSHADAWVNHFLTKPMSKHELDTRLDEIITSCTRYDHLLVYMSGADAKGPTISKNKMAGIMPKAHTIIETIFQQAKSGGLTVIYDGLFEAAPRMHELLHDGKVLFFSSQGNQPLKKAKKAVSEFTSALCEAILGDSAPHTNSQLYAAIIQRYNNRIASPKKTEAPLNSPGILCNRETAGFPFAHNRTLRDSAQHGLRLLGYSNTSAHGDWTTDDEKNLVLFASERHLNADIHALLPVINREVAEFTKNTNPLFLFVFSDPHGQLNTIENEIFLVKEIFKDTLLSRSIEIKVMHNRRLAEIDAYIRHPDNRNRLEFFYYSGMDRDGNAVFSDGELTIEWWAEWLSFHTRLEFVVFNTCRAALLAEQLTQIGIGMAIGAFNEISDQYGEYFADLLFKAMAFNTSMEMLPFSQIEQRV